MSQKCRLCCKSLFAPLIANFSSCRRGFRVNMWGELIARLFRRTDRQGRQPVVIVFGGPCLRGSHMLDRNRREFITLLGGAAAWPVMAGAQQPGMPVIGFLNIASPEAWTQYVMAFKQGLGQTGFVEGRNVAIEYQWASGDYSRLAALATDLAGLRVRVIAANGGSSAALAAKSATATIPIVFTFGDGDPVKHGLVESINHPGRNITGVTMIAGALEPKRLELLREIAPKATVVHILACKSPQCRRAPGHSRRSGRGGQTSDLHLMWCRPAARARSTLHSRPWTARKPRCSWSRTTVF